MTQLDEDVASGAYQPAESDEDVHGSLERGLSSAPVPSWAASCGQTGRATTRW